VNLTAAEGSNTNPKPKNQVIASLNGLVFALCVTERATQIPRNHETSEALPLVDKICGKEQEKWNRKP